MISLSKVMFSYTEAFDGFRLGPVDLEMHPGRIYGWRGNNGSGKSTLASILAGQRTAVSGRIEGLPPRILYFQQNIAANIFPDLKVGEHLLLCRDAERRREILQVFPSLAPLLEKYPDTLSGGQVQRLAFSLSLIRDFDLYIFDEVTNHLDRETVALVGATMRSLVERRASATVVFISHDPQFLEAFSDQTCIFDEGRVTPANNHLCPPTISRRGETTLLL
jgi:ABC-type multidrug transport system ATPase subunit